MAVFKCSLCEIFYCLGLRALLNHIYSVHSQELNFKAACNVNGCPSTFTKYNSLYKHILKHHREVYDAAKEDAETDVSNQKSPDEPAGSRDPTESLNHDTQDNSEEELQDQYGNDDHDDTIIEAEGLEEEEEIEDDDSDDENDDNNEDEEENNDQVISFIQLNEHISVAIQ